MNTEDFFSEIYNGGFCDDTTQLSPLQLAYIGDCVYELLVRSKVLKSPQVSVKKLNNQARSFVCAASQSDIYKILTEHLSEEEMCVMKRGRNAKSHSRSRSASMSEYRHATGLEVLFGHLHLASDKARLREIFLICVESGEDVADG